MPRKPSQKTEASQNRQNTPNVPSTVPENDVEVEVQVVPQKTRKRPPAQAAGAAKVSENSSVAESTVESNVVSSVAETTVPKNRQVPTRDSVESEFNQILTSIEDEIERIRSSSSKSKGVKFLRTVNKNLKTLRTHALRISRNTHSTRRTNTNSGFLKPVQISKELAKFTGWDQSQLRSRVDVTKFICEYIKQHNLQDPLDKRNIRVDSDPSLKKLLNFENKDGKPLTYYSLQSYLKSHFTPPAVQQTSPPAPTPTSSSSVSHSTPARKPTKQ